MPMLQRTAPVRFAILLLAGGWALAACSESASNRPSGNSAGESSGGETSTGASGQAGTEDGGTSGGGSIAGSGGAQGGSSSAGQAGKGGSAGASASGGKGGGSSLGGEGVEAEASAGSGGDAPAGAGGEGGNGPAQAGCGNGVVEAGEQCEPNSTATCSESCASVSTQACVDCEQAGACADFSNICVDGFAGDDERSICYAVQQCVRDSNCADGVKDLKSCFCGALSTADCSSAPNAGAGAPAGACAGVIREALSEGAEVATNAQVLARLIDQSFPGGAALARINCDKLDGACIATCGYGN